MVLDCLPSIVQEYQAAVDVVGCAILLAVEDDPDTPWTSDAKTAGILTEEAAISLVCLQASTTHQVRLVEEVSCRSRSGQE